MPYIGQRPATGEANSFKILDDISNYTLTFGSSDIDTSADTIAAREHRFVTGQRVTYGNGGGTDPTGLSNGTVYYIIVEDRHTFKLAANASDAASGSAINISTQGSGASHTINVAFDGVNTKFKATHTNGTKADISQSGQLMVSVNGVLQQPHDNTTTPSTGYATDHTSTIIFSAAPTAGDQFFGRLIASNFATFDISDNTVDNFTGDGNTSTFTLSKNPPNNESVLVTIDGVVQYPDDNSAVRAYTVSENVIDFASAPGNGVEIQVRHIGFAGASTGGISGFYGRTGNAVLKNTDDIVFRNANVGVVTATDIRVTGNLTVDGTTTTLDTELVGVDKLEVNANNTTSAGIITQTGSGDILNLYDGASEVFSVLDGGDVGIARSIFHLGDTNTSIGFPSDDTIKLQVNDSQLNYIDVNSTRTRFHRPIMVGDYISHATVDSLGVKFSNAGAGNNGTHIGLAAEDNGVNVNHRTFRVFRQGGIYERMRIHSDGNIGINSTAPGEKLDVLGTIRASAGTNQYVNMYPVAGAGYFDVRNTTTYPSIVFRQIGSGGTQERLRIASDGSVGIGSAIPAQTLDIMSANPVIRLTDTDPAGVYSQIDGAGGDLILSADGGAGSSNSFISLRVDGTDANAEKLRITSGGALLVAKTTTSLTTQGSRVDDGLITVSGDSSSTNLSTNSGGNLSLANIDSTDNNFSNIGGYNSNGLVVSQIDFINKSHSSRTGDIAFLTHNGSAMSEKLRITSTGDMGLGTATPTPFGPTLQVAGTDPALLLQDTATAVDYFGMNIASGAVNTWFDDASAFIIHTASGLSGSGLVERLRITSDGGVGIGTDTPYVNNSFTSLSIGGSGKYGLIELNKSDGVAGSWIDVYGTNGNGDLRITTAGTNGSITFWTGGSFTETVRITSGGNIGIGTYNPDDRLHVLGGNIQIGKTEQSGYETVITNNALIFNRNAASYIDQAGTGDIRFRYGANDATWMHMEGANGRIGIGTEIPTSDLHVFGSTDASSIVDAAAGDALLTLRNAGNTNWSGINFTRERSTGTNVTGGSIWMPSDTSNNGATLYLQTQSASANAGADGALTDDNGVRLKLASQPGGSGPNSAFTVELGSTEKFRIKSGGEITSGNISINAFANSNTPGGYSQFQSDNHSNTIFGQNLKLGASAGSGNHQIEIINQHANIGGAGMYIGGNGSNQENAINFYAETANQSPGTDVTANRRAQIASSAFFTWVEPRNLTANGTSYLRTFGFTFNLQEGETETVFYNPDGYRRIWYEMYFQSGHGSNGYGYILANISRYGMQVHDVDWHVSYTSYAFSGSVGGNVNHNGIKFTRNSGYANTNITYYVIVKAFSPAGGSPYNNSGLTDPTYRYFTQGY